MKRLVVVSIVCISLLAFMGLAGCKSSQDSSATGLPAASVDKHTTASSNPHGAPPPSDSIPPGVKAGPKATITLAPTNSAKPGAAVTINSPARAPLVDPSYVPKGPAPENAPDNSNSQTSAPPPLAPPPGPVGQ